MFHYVNNFILIFVGSSPNSGKSNGVNEILIQQLILEYSISDYSFNYC